MGSETAVHHKTPCGQLKDWDDLEAFARNLFAEADQFIVLCTDCHKIGHDEEKAAAKEARNSV